MKVKQTNFDTFNNYSTIILLIIENPSVRIWSNRFQMVMINYTVKTHIYEPRISRSG